MRALALLLCVGCSALPGAASDVSAESWVAAEPEVSESKPAGIHYAITLEPEMAADGVAAVQLLKAATRGFYDPVLTIGACTGSEAVCVRAQDVVPDCRGEHEPWGCMWPTGEVDIWRGMHPELRVSIVLHELGHTLGLSHEDASFMDPERSWLELYRVCVGQVALLELQRQLHVPEIEPVCLRSVGEAE